MKFHRITLRDYRAIRLLSFEPAETGITIVQGDNEVGKSSIAEALWLIFEQHDDSASQAVRSIRPVDRDVAPEIEVDVSTGPYRFTYFKRFHRGSRTELRIKQPRAEVLTGRDADNRATQILGETIDVALWKALRFQQGVSDDLEQVSAGKHQSLLSALDAASDLLGGEREQSLFERVQQEYERYFTASGREKAAGDAPNAARLRRARDDAAANVERLTERIITLETRALRAAQLDRDIHELELQRETSAGLRERLAEAAQVHREQTTKVQAAASDLRAAEAAEREAAAALDARVREAAALEPKRTELAALTEESEGLGPPLSAAREAAETARAALASAEEAHASARVALSAADDKLHLASAAFTAETMAERLERLERNEPEARRLRQWLADCRLDARGLAAIREAADHLKTLKVRRNSEGAAVEVAAPTNLQIEIDGKPVSLEAGRAKRGTVLGVSTIVLPDGVTITVRAGTAARDLEAQTARAEEELRELLAAASVTSLEAADDTLNQRAANEAALRGVEQQITADLRDLSSVEELRQKLDREQARIKEAQASGDVPSIEAAKAAREAAGQSFAATETTLREARSTSDDAVRALGGLEQRHASLAERAARLNEELDQMVAALAASRAVASDEALSQRRAEAETLRIAADASAAAAEELLARCEDVSADLEAAETEARQLDALWIAATREHAEIQGVLEDAGADGLHGQLTTAEQDLAAAEDELEAYLRLATSARILFEALKRHRDAAKENYAGPLRQKIEELGKLAYGGDFAVELSDDLRVVKRTLGGITLDVPQLSTGAREQLSVLTRLACASLVSEGGGAPLVLDDIFGWADPKRLKALGPVLAKAAASTQVLLFTCTPGRFDSVAPARVISLPSGSSFDRDGAGEQQPEAPGAPSSVVRKPEPPAVATPAPQAAFDLFAEREPAGTP